MVAAYRDLKEDLWAASDAVLALHRIEQPTNGQRLGAMLEADFKLHVISALTKKPG